MHSTCFACFQMVSPSSCFRRPSPIPYLGVTRRIPASALIRMPWSCRLRMPRMKVSASAMHRTQVVALHQMAPDLHRMETLAAPLPVAARRAMPAALSVRTPSLVHRTRSAAAAVAQMLYSHRVIHTYTHTYTHIHEHAHTYTHTRTQSSQTHVRLETRAHIHTHPILITLTPQNTHIQPPLLVHSHTSKLSLTAPQHVIITRTRFSSHCLCSYECLYVRLADAPKPELVLPNCIASSSSLSLAGF